MTGRGCERWRSEWVTVVGFRREAERFGTICTHVTDWHAPQLLRWALCRKSASLAGVGLPSRDDRVDLGVPSVFASLVDSNECKDAEVATAL